MDLKILLVRVLLIKFFHGLEMIFVFFIIQKMSESEGEQILNPINLYWNF